MKRIAMLAAMIAAGAFASVASADPGTDAAAHRQAVTRTEWTAEYDAPGYYGDVRCTGKTIVNKKYPGGRDVESCEAVSGTLENVEAGKEQHAFKTSEGGTVGEWESDSGDGKRTTDYSYSVNKKLTKFRLVAIYPAPEEP